MPNRESGKPNSESGIRTPIPPEQPKSFGMGAELAFGIRRNVRSACSGFSVRHGPDYAP